VLAEAQAVFLSGSFLSRRIECAGSMHDWNAVASDALTAILAAIFRGAERVALSSYPVPVSHS
jgi:hypothetical protein